MTVASGNAETVLVMFKANGETVVVVVVSSPPVELIMDDVGANVEGIAGNSVEALLAMPVNETVVVEGVVVVVMLL